MDRPEFESAQGVIEEMIVMFGADIEDILEGVLSDLSKTELESVYDLMVISYELGQEEA